MSESQIKGACIKSVLEQLGKAGSLGPILDGLAPAERELFSGMILTAGWYPVEAYLALLERVVAHHGDGDLAYCYKVGQGIIRDGLGTIYKALVKLSSPESTLKRSPLIWSLYFQASTLTIEEVRKGSARVSVHAAGRTTRPYCATQMGGMDEAIATSGGKNPRILHPTCRVDGFPRCVFELSWER